VLLAIGAVLAGLAGNIYMNPPYFRVFLHYFIPAILIVAIMLGRIALLKGAMFVIRQIISAIVKPLGRLNQAIRDKIEQINSQQVVFFTRGDNLANLNAAMLYVQRNEHTNRVKVVTVVKDPGDVPEDLRTNLKFLDETYPEIDIEFVVLEGVFGPELIRTLAEKWEIPPNFMFIGSPGGHLMYGLAELGGVRLII